MPGDSSVEVSSANVYPDQDEALSAEPLLEWIDERFLRSDPFALGSESFKEIVRLLTRELDVSANGIFCIGSGAIGLSFNPKKVDKGQLKKFDDHSDIDLAVISEEHFETAWRDLRRMVQPILTEADETVRKNIEWQRKKFFDGAIIANKLLPSLSFGGEWLSALVKVGQHASVSLNRNKIEVNLWIYRDYWSLRNYVAVGLTECRKALV
jgi:hypothetical protein